MGKQYSIVYMYYKFFIHSSVDGCLGCFHVLAIVNSASVNNGIHVSFSVLVFSWYIPRSGISGSQGSFLFPQFLGISIIIFHSGCINLHSHQQCKSVFSSHHLNLLLFCRLLEDGHSDWCEMISHCSFDLHFSNNERC